MAKHLKAIYRCVAGAFYAGRTVQEIALDYDLSEQTVLDLLSAPAIKEYIQQIRNGTVDTVADTVTDIQANMPDAMLVLRELMLHGKNETVRRQAAESMLQMGGMAPVKRVEIQRAGSVEDKIEQLSEEELRREISKGLATKPTDDDQPTMH